MNKTDSKSKNVDQGVSPHFTKTESLRPFSPREHHRFIGASKKSHLWKESLKSDLIYLNSEFVYMSYRVTKNQETKDYLNGLDYFLSKSLDKVHIIVGKLPVFSSKLATISKYQFNTINVIITNKVRNALPDQNLGLCESVLMEDLRSLRWCGIGSLIILADSLHNYAEVKEYFNSIIKSMGWEDFKKATFIFPAFMTI